MYFFTCSTHCHANKNQTKTKIQDTIMRYQDIFHPSFAIASLVQDVKYYPSVCEFLILYFQVLYIQIYSNESVGGKYKLKDIITASLLQ